MTATASTGRSNVIVWIGVALVAALVLLVAFAGQDDATVGTTGDPSGTGRTGMLALRLLVDESGGTTDADVDYPDASHDVAVMALPLYVDVLAQFDESEEDTTAEIVRPLLDWVEAGGVLITGVDLDGGPPSAFAFVDEDEEVGVGTCTIDRLAALTSVRALPHSPAEVATSDESCFGDGTEALVVERSLGAGSIVRLATSELMYNQSLDDADNAALMARVMNLGPGRSVAFLTGPGLLGAPGTVPVNEDGDPVGAGDGGVFDLVPNTVIALLVGLGGAFLLYALSQGRRLGSPVEEPQPIELPSSSYTEAVGRLFARAERAPARSGDVLRHEFRTGMARRVGLGAEASSEELARALAIPTGMDEARLRDLLDGPPPADDAALVALATDLATARDAMTRGRSTLVTATKGTTE
jgi:hypothetical protein